MPTDDLIKKIDKLPSLPEVCLRINEMMDDQRCSALDIAQVIAQDTALSARLLKIVNSAFYSLPVKIETISRAVTIVGVQELRDLSMMTAACDLFRGIPTDLFNMENFWHYSVTCGIVARGLAGHCAILHPERLFVMGVLHDLGRLVILEELPVAARDVLFLSKGRLDLMLSAEEEILGFTHCQVGAELARAWKLPETIATVIEWHHEPSLSPGYPLETALIHIAANAANALVLDGELGELKEKVNPHAWAVAEITPETCIQVIGEVAGEIHSFYSLLMQPQSLPKASG